MRSLIGFLLLLFFSLPAFPQGYLTPLDFGLETSTHGRTNYSQKPDNVLCGQFNADVYMDIARFCGNRLEVYYLQGEGYPCSPQGVKCFDQPIRSIAHDDNPWDQVDNIIVTLTDGSQQTLWKKGGRLDLEIAQGFLPTAWKAAPPRQVDEFDFQIVWQSETHPYGMDRVAVGDLDNDGVNELVTWWKDSLYADTAYMLIYKCTGDNQHELFMQEPFYGTYLPEQRGHLTNLLIDDLDRNGQKELIFTNYYCHFWEFSAPGVYFPYRSAWGFSRAPVDVKITDVDQDSILEFTYLGQNYGYNPPGILSVKEYQGKSQIDSVVNFTEMTDITIGGGSYHIAVGDYDNDRSVDIVVGYNGGFMSSWYDTWVQVFRHNVNVPEYFEEHWIEPNIWANSNCPIIADFDNDGEQEIYIAGGGGYSSSISNGCGSAYIWESTGIETGYVAWWDTVTMYGAVNNLAFAYVDSVNCIINNTVEITTTEIRGRFHLFGNYNGQYQPLWRSQSLQGISYGWTICSLDLDQDGSMNFVTTKNIDGFSVPDVICDWEQTSTGIEFIHSPELPLQFTLYPNSPNPFNSTTIISFELQVKSDVELTIFDVTGRMVLDWKQNNLPPGNYSYPWRANNLSSGIYLITLHTANAQQIQKAVLLK